MINLKQLATHVVEPVLKGLNMYSEAAVVLLLGTAYCESRLHYLKQIKGPALGFYQVEPDTHYDIWENYLAFRPKLANKIIEQSTVKNATKWIGSAHNNPANFLQDELITNLAYATAIARLVYRRDPDQIPEIGAYTMAEYYKLVYNTVKGRANVDESAMLFSYVLKTLGYVNENVVR